MVDVFLNLFNVFWQLLRLPIVLGGILIGVFLLVVFINCLYLYVFKGVRKPKGEHYRVKKRNFFLRIFVDAPIRIAKDYMTRDPEWFRHQGLIVFTGRQGRGKTVALVEHTLRMQEEYPKAKCISNLNYKYQDDELDHWSKLIDYQNPHGRDRGVICQIDELQNWFSSNMSKDFPPEMLEVITQNRKNRRIILGTAQVFNRLAKPLREQTTEVRECLTLAGAITIVVRKEPILDSDGNVEKMKYRGMYFFVQDDKIREAYDTYKVIESLRKSGFYYNPALHSEAPGKVEITAKGKKITVK